MKAKLLRKVRSKVTLQERNGMYYIFRRGEIVWKHNWLGVAKLIYRNEVIDFAKDLFTPKSKKRIL